MTHLTITIDIPIDVKDAELVEYEAKHAANEAYKAARKALPYWTPYNKEDFSFKVEKQIMKRLKLLPILLILIPLIIIAYVCYKRQKLIP